MRTRVLASLLTVGLLGLTTIASAQPAIGGGVKGGVNFSTVTGEIERNVTKSVLTGGIFGGFLTAWFNDMWAFQPEVLYSMTGVKAKFTERSTTIEAKEKIDVVEIPLLLRGGRRSKDRAAGYFLVGPDIGIISRAKGVVSGQPDDDFKDELKSANFSVVVAGGVTVRHFLVEARYTGGVRDLNKTPNSDGTKNRSQVFSIMVGGEW